MILFQLNVNTIKMYRPPLQSHLHILLPVSVHCRCCAFPLHRLALEFQFAAGELLPFAVVVQFESRIFPLDEYAIVRQFHEHYVCVVLDGILE